MGHVFNPVPLIPISGSMLKFAGARSLVPYPLSFIGCTIFPDLTPMPFALLSAPLAFVGRAVRKLEKSPQLTLSNALRL
jgi:hypothetical protein